MHKGNLVVEKDKYEVIDCEACGFKHLNPIPFQKEIKDYYKNKYYQSGAQKLLDPEKELKDMKWMTLAYKDMLEVLSQYVSQASRKLLDVGCGNGFFLQFMRNNGWKTVGIEPSIKAYEYAFSLGLNVFNSTFGEFIQKKRQGYFDVINLHHILEHMLDPLETLSNCKKILKSSGLICIEVPNDFNAFQQQLHKTGMPQWWVVAPVHINYFNFESLERLLVSSGFEIILKTTNFPMELFMLMGERYIDNGRVGKVCHQKRMMFELNIPDKLRRDIYTSLAELGLGRNCIFYAKLKNKGKNGS